MDMIRRLKKQYDCNSFEVMFANSELIKTEVTYNMCGAGVKVLAIKSTGEVLPCITYETVLGKISSGSEIKNILENNAAKFLTSKMAGTEICGDCKWRMNVNTVVQLLVLIRPKSKVVLGSNNLKW